MSSTRSPGARIRTSAIRWYSSTVNRRRLSVTAMSILKAGCEALSTPQLRYTAFDLEGRLMSFVSHVECTVCGHRHDPKRPLTVCETCGQMLAARYDLERVKASVSKDALRQRPPGMYRFRELTPLDAGEVPVTLGEGGSPCSRSRGWRPTSGCAGSGPRMRARIPRAPSRRAASPWRSRARGR